MKKMVFFGYVILCATGLLGKIDIPVHNDLEIVSFDYEAADFDDSDDDMNVTQEEINEVLAPNLHVNSERYQTQEIIGQGEGPDALNPVNPDTSNRSRAGSFTDQMAMYHNQIVHQNLENNLTIVTDDEQSVDVGFIQIDVDYDNGYYMHG